MAASYSETAFKLHLPQVLQYDDHIKVNFNFEYKLNCTEKIIYYKSELTERVKVTHFDTNSAHGYLSESRKYPDSVCIWQTNRKIFINSSILKMVFLSSSGMRTEVEFKIVTAEKTELLNVSTFQMTGEEKEIFVSVINREMSCNNETSGSANVNAGSNTYSDIKTTEVDTCSIPGLDEYKDALRKEKLFLMHEGGRKYKVTNGKLISNEKGVYSYLFDLETELHISDDAPVRIVVGVTSVNGNVLMCEDFQVIVQLEKSIGDRVGTAYLSVEPWKLLEALEERLSRVISLSNSVIAGELLKKGPSLASERPIEQIPKGQGAAIEKAKRDPVCIIWGPPGTGKTHTMSELAIEFVEQGKNVLIVSHSNVSVDGVARKIDELLRKKGKTEILEAGKVQRYGYVRDEQLNKNPHVNSFLYAVTKNPTLNKELDSLQSEYDRIRHTSGLNSPRVIEIRKQIGQIRNQIREQEQRYVSNASVVATTISKVVIDKIFDEKKYDVVMFDEVSMAYVPQVICAATFAKEHLICVGDFMQLAPIAQSKAKEVLCKDIFTFLGINVNGKPYYHPWLVMLDEQRRMHPRISEFANRYVYRGLLKDHESTQTSREHIVKTELFENQAINLVDMTGSYCAAAKNSDNSRYNILSALISFCSAVKTESNVETVSIITPYAAQTRLIRALVLDYRKKDETEIRCATVHQFQGSESDVILFDAVESFPSKRTGYLMGKDFNSILRLINVAVTRARGKLITISNCRFWEKHYTNTNHTLYKLLRYISDRGNTVRHVRDKSLEGLIRRLSTKHGPKFYLSAAEYIEKLLDDIGRAKGKIVISLPSGQVDEEYEKVVMDNLCKAEDNGVQLLIKTNDYAHLPARWKKYSSGTDNAVLPIILIDDKITWYGAPNAKWVFEDAGTQYTTVCPITCRIEGEHTAEMIKSLSDLEYIETAGGKRPLTSKPQEGSSEGKSAGFSEYVKEKIKCSSCKKSMVLSRGKSGKAILWCRTCKKTELLSPEYINHYLDINDITCPEHKCFVKARLGKYGVYIRCEEGHPIRPEDL